MIKQKIETWQAEGKEKYGEFPNWKLKCPSCGHVQTPQNFIDISKDAETALFNCIGRHQKGVGCDWAAGGLFKTMGKGRQIKKDGVTHEIFSFEDDSNAKIDNIEAAPYPGLGVKSWNDFTWPEYVPQDVRDQVQKFWSDFSRNPDEWAKSAVQNRAPAFGEEVTLREVASDKTITGKFIFAWNNIGRIIDAEGKTHCVSF